MGTKIDDTFIEEILEKLRGNKALARKLHHILEEEFVRKVEIKEILEEIKQLREESNKRWEELMKEFKERSKQVDDWFDKMDEKIEKILKELRIGLGYSLEQLSKSVVLKLMESRGYEVEKLEKRHFEDPEMVVHKDSTDVEVDLFSEEPLIIGETTGSIRKLRKVNQFIRKIQFLEQRLNKKATLKVLITYRIREDIQQKAQAKLEKAGVLLITIED